MGKGELMDTEPLWTALRTGNVPTAIDLLRTWLAAAVPGEAELLIESAPLDIRAHLSVLMLDLLTCWPKTLLGVPVQLYAARANDTPPKQRLFLFPESPVCIVPIRGLVFLGWLSEHTQLPMAAGTPKPKCCGMERIVCQIALFRAQPDFDYDNLKIPPKWWVDLFADCQADIYLSAHNLQPFPIACELGQVLAEAGRGNIWSDEYFFITQSQAQWARETGPIFHREGEIHIPNFEIQQDWPEIFEDDDI